MGFTVNLLFADISANKQLPAETVSANKLLSTENVSVNKADLEHYLINVYKDIM